MFTIILKRAIGGFIEKESAFISGTLAFYALLAFFPFVMFLTALAGMYGDTFEVQRAIHYFIENTPREIQDVVMPVLKEILEIKEGGLVTFGLLVTLWVLMSGVDALRLGLNRAYGITEKRPYLMRKLQSIGFVIFATIALTLTSMAIILGPLLLDWLYQLVPMAEHWALWWNMVRYAFATTIMVLLLSSIYYYLPNIHHTWPRVVPGAVLATVLWLMLASLFSVYLSHTDRFSVTYGSLSGIIIALVFLKASAIIFLFGAEINHAYHQYRHQENRGEIDESTTE